MKKLILIASLTLCSLDVTATPFESQVNHYCTGSGTCQSTTFNLVLEPWNGQSSGQGYTMYLNAGNYNLSCELMASGKPRQVYISTNIKEEQHYFNKVKGIVKINLPVENELDVFAMHTQPSSTGIEDSIQCTVKSTSKFLREN